MARDERHKQGLANASVNTSVRGGEHDGETDGSTPRNLGLPADDQQKGLDIAAREKPPGSQDRPPADGAKKREKPSQPR